MLNISLHSIAASIEKDKYSIFQKLDRKSTSRSLIKVLLSVSLIATISLFLPWTQNIRSKGYVTTMNPYDRPQEIQSLLAGQITEWHVNEGDMVAKGDTIAILTESKEEYLDPEIVKNTQLQREAKLQSAESNRVKIDNLRDQLTALTVNYESKMEQNEIKSDQVYLKMDSDSLELEAAQIRLENADKQLARMNTMFEKGLKSLTDLETKRLSFREAVAKKTYVENQLLQLQNEALNLSQERINIESDYQQKSAKIEAEIMSTNSYRFSIISETDKLQSKINNLEQRQKAYVITSPINGMINKTLKNGVGEFVKKQESIAHVTPIDYRLAVELYVKPNDIPLVKRGKDVRILFDGWPAVVFSGWPQNSLGTFKGQVYSIDNYISENGKYRVLVIESDPAEPWPEEVRIGSGANGLLLLNQVKVYYELWRQLNGFPPDYYEPMLFEGEKTKAPMRKIK